MNYITLRFTTANNFKSILALLVVFFLSISSFGQNALVGSGFSTGWGGGTCSPGNGNFKYLASSAGTSFAVTTNANGTGNQYFRFGVDWGGTTSHLAITPGADTSISPNTTYNLNTSCTTSGSQYINVGNTSYNYIFKTLNAGSAPTGTFTFFEVQGAVRSVSSVAQMPLSTSVTPSSTTTVTATLNGAFSTGQDVYLRYTKDGFSTSTVVKMTGSGTSYSANIPSAFNTAGANVVYYIFTSGNAGVNAAGSNADLYTINLNNFGGSNYSYTVTTPPVVTAGSPTGTYNAAFSYNIIASNSPTSYAVASGTLPAGLSLNTTTGAITGTPTAAGSSSVTVTATNSEGTSTPATLNFTIAKANQTITFAALTPVTYGVAPYALTGTASSTLTVTYASSNTAVATVSGSTITIVGVGNTNITASQSGDTNYNLATDVVRALTVNSKTLTISGITANNKVQDGSTTATLSGTPSLVGVVAADSGNVTVSGTPTATFASSSVGTGIAVSVVGYTLSGSAAGNYTLTQPASLTANITGLSTPVATAATNVLQTQFDANWNAVSDANDGYLLDVSTSATFGTGTVTVTIAGQATINSTVNTLTADTQYYFRLRAKNGTAESANSNAIPVKTKAVSCTWDGSAWSNTTGPDADIEAIIAGVYSTNSNGVFTAKKLTVNSGSLTVNSGTTITVVNELINNLTGANVLFENNSNLIQINDVANTGSIKVNRNSSLIMRQDYTLWSSPVAGQNLLAFSPNTLTSRFYTYVTDASPTPNVYIAVPSPGATSFSTGTGYLIRTPNNFPTTATNWPGTFNGVPNNGTHTIGLTNAAAGQRFNLIGNPYPSPIDMNQFVTDNSDITGTLYFWRKTNSTTSSPGYCTWTAGTFVTNSEAQAFDPNDVIRTGQGFMVEATAYGSTVQFNNGQRISDTANQFFRTNAAAKSTTIEKNRYWLNVTNGNGGFAQMAVGYITDATQGVDRFDGKYFANGTLALNSLIGSAEYTIQGRALPFVDSDVVPLNFKTDATGSYTISLDHKDGLFADGSQNIFLKDNLLNSYTNMNSNSYTFTSDAGVFADRFEIVYVNGTLGIDTPTLTSNQVVIYKNNSDTIINSGNIEMATVKIFDLRGRLLLEKNNINANETKVNLGTTKQIVLVQITSIDGQVATKKATN